MRDIINESKLIFLLYNKGKRLIQIPLGGKNMIKVEEVRKARLNELFFATIKKKPTWEEVGAIKIGESLDYPRDMSPSKVLHLSIDMVTEAGLVSAEKVPELTKELKTAILSEMAEEKPTVVYKKGDEYFDLTEMKTLDSENKPRNMARVSRYATKQDIEFEEENGKVYFRVEEGCYQRYLNEIHYASFM